MTIGMRQKILTLTIILLALIGAAMPLRTVYAHRDYFRIDPVPEEMAEDMRENGVWKPHCPVPIERLRLVTVSYVDFEGNTQRDGQIMVLDVVAKEVLAIFKELYKRRFPIEKIRPITECKGDDEASMAMNNTSAFNCRSNAGGGPISVHAYGVAIDLNPLQNPFVQVDTETPGQMTVGPALGKDYINRTNVRPGMVEPVVKLFEKHGFFAWGGRWNTPLDWQHFQVSREVAKLLAAMEPEHAEDLFSLCIRYPSRLRAIPFNDVYQEIEALYHQDPVRFVSAFKKAIVKGPKEMDSVMLLKAIQRYLSR